MKKTIFFLIIFLFSVQLSAQNEEQFSSSSDIFITQIDELLKSSTNKTLQQQGTELMTTVLEKWNSGRFSKEEKDLIRDISEKMLEKKLKAHPNFYNFFSVINEFAFSSQKAKSIDNWLKVTYLIISKKSARIFSDHLTNTKEVLTEGILQKRSLLDWRMIDADFEFVSDSSFVIEMYRGNLMCKSSNDSSLIQATTGVFFQESSTWLGKKGKISWQRFGSDFSEVYVDISDYSIDLSKSEYKIDSVLFTNNEYFDFRIPGSFADKITTARISERTSYPQFASYDNDYQIKDIFNNIDFSGSIGMEGKSFCGRGSELHKAEIVIRQENKIVARFNSNSFIFNESKISSENALTVIYLGQDSIFHQGLNLKYNDIKRFLSLYVSKNKTPFNDSYHGIYVEAESIKWDIDKKMISFQQLEGVQDSNKASFYSKSYYSNKDFSSLQGIDPVNPIYLLNDYLKIHKGENRFTLHDFATFINRPIEQAASMILKLSSFGYLTYDTEDRTATVLPRFYDVIATRSGKIDFDVIKIYSKTKKSLSNFILDLETFDFEINGVTTILFSEKKNVFAQIDKSEKILMRKNRNIVFSGSINAGRSTLFSTDGIFNYANFTIEMPKIDSISFYVLDKKSKKIIPVKNVLTNLSGNLYIDEKENKSGKSTYHQFPIFDCKQESYAYFNRSFINQGLLSKEDFYYVANPFTLDSLNNFSSTISFDGYLNSGNIFPTIVEKLVVTDDYSLGFDHKTDSDGYQMYQKNGIFNENIHLSNKGFLGTGIIDFASSTSKSDNFIFYPDSVIAQTRSFDMKAVEQPIGFPKAQSDTLFFNWQVAKNEIQLTTISNPLNLYDNSIFHGKAILKESGLNASGTLEFDNATIKSKQFDFDYLSFMAENSNFWIYSPDLKKELFYAPNSNAAIDFKTRQGEISTTIDDGLLYFPSNSYICTFDLAKWVIDDKKLFLSNNQKTEYDNVKDKGYEYLVKNHPVGSMFTSVHPKQDSLTFLSSKAEFDIDKHIINAQDANIIRVADVGVFPKDGLVSILDNGDMEPLKEAYIIADTSNLYFPFRDAFVKIFSKKDYLANGIGQYNFEIDGKKQDIPFSQIKSNDNGTTVASGTITEDVLFQLNDHFHFYGNVLLTANKKEMEFDGGFKMIQNCVSSNWVAFKTDINPDSVAIPVKESVGTNQAKLQTGFFFNSTRNQYYVAMFGASTTASAPLNVCTNEGILSFDDKLNSFLLKDNKAPFYNSELNLSLDRCVLSGKGELDLGLELSLVNITTIGDYNYKTIPDSASIKVTVLLDFIFENKLLELMAENLAKSNSESVNLLETNLLFALSKFLDEDDIVKATSEINELGYLRRVPNAFDKSITITDVELKWHPDLNSFISTGPIVVGNINKKMINKKMDGYIAFENSRSGDAVSIYLMPDKNQWYFFHYERGVMQAISSSEVFNNMLLDIKRDKRITNDKKTNLTYEFVLSTKRTATDFVRKVQSADF